FHPPLAEHAQEAAGFDFLRVQDDRVRAELAADHLHGFRQVARQVPFHLHAFTTPTLCTSMFGSNSLYDRTVMSCRLRSSNCSKYMLCVGDLRMIGCCPEWTWRLTCSVSR